MIPTGKTTVYIDADIEELIPGFLENRRHDVQSMRQALDEGDFEAIRFTGHGMKGAGGGYGFDFISEIGDVLEQAADEKDASQIREMVDQLHDYLQQIEVVFQ